MYLGYSKKIKESNKESGDNLRKRISKRTFIISARLNSITDAEKERDLLGALSTLNQAMMLVDHDEKESLRLFNIAVRLGKV